MVDRDVAALEVVADETRRVARNKDLQVHVAVCDITSDTGVSLLSGRIRQEIGGLDVLVINAGLWRQPAIRMTKESTK